MNDNRGRPRSFRIIDRRERWGLTLWGWAAVLLLTCAAVLGLVPRIHGFLAIDCPVRGEVFVVEGWIPDYAIPGAVSEFDKNGYKRMIAVGGPIEKGSHLSDFKNYARLTQATLNAHGFSEERVVVLETRDIKKDRTYESAKAVRRWAESHGVQVKGLDVYTLGAHARRSRLLFQKAFGEDVAVGVIAAEDQSYDPMSWWKCSEGVRTVMSEFIAYVYAAAFFYP
jgi:hypothetical protein